MFRYIKLSDRRALDVIGDWWSLLIVRDAFLGKRRFGEFQKSLGLAKNILCTRLQKLVSHGILRARPGLGRQRLPGVHAHGEGPRPLHRPRRPAAVGGDIACSRRGSWTCCWWTGKPASRSSPWNCGRRTDACWGRTTCAPSPGRVDDGRHRVATVTGMSRRGAAQPRGLLRTRKPTESGLRGRSRRGRTTAGSAFMAISRRCFPTSSRAGNARGGVDKICREVYLFPADCGTEAGPSSTRRRRGSSSRQ